MAFAIMQLTPQICCDCACQDDNKMNRVEGNMIGHICVLSLVIATLFAGVPASHAADEVQDASAEKCISVRRIRQTKIIDDLNIIFYLSGQKTYHNILPRRCSGLAREDRFSYRTSVGQLCDIDSIRVLQGGARGLEEGISCRLGLFHPISKEDAEALTDKSHTMPEAEPIQLPKPEEVGAEDEESGN